MLSVATSFVVSKLIAPRGSRGNSQQEDAITGARIQLPPATNNKLPVVYGTAFVGGSITDAKISSDLQTMWYVIAMAEVTNTMPGDTPDAITFQELYYDSKLASMSGARVTSLSTNTAGGPEVDTKVNGNLFIYTFPNGSFSGTNTDGQSAIDIMSDPAIPENQRWDQGIYTENGQSADMTNTAFVIVKLKFNNDAGTTGLGAVTAKIANSRSKPGECITDYLLNSRYGCDVPLAGIDTASMSALNAYSDKPIVYTPMGGGSPTTRPRYRINGPIDTTKNCLSNLQDMVDACDSWMQYSELTGKWKVVINKAYDETPNGLSFSQLYNVTSNNLTSGIQINPTDLNQTYNQVEYQYPNTNVKDQLDFIFISLQDDYPSLLSENEPTNKLGIKNDLVNNYVQAKFIAIRRLLQSREDLIINFQTDYSGIQVEAGDVIRVNHETYGWTDKLFRVSNVTEEKDSEGNLFARLTAFEYNATIYDDDLDITDFVPEANTGLQDPNNIGTPNAPTVVLNTANTINTLNITGIVPTQGLVRYLDFNYGNSSNSQTHQYYTTRSNSNGEPLAGNSVYTINVNDIQNAGNLYWSVTAKNTQTGVRSNSSSVVAWPGAGITVYNSTSNTGGITSNNIGPNVISQQNLNFVVPEGIPAVNTLPTCNSAKAGFTVFLTTDNKLYTCDGSTFSPTVSNVNISGNIIASQIANVFANSVFGSLSNANVPNASIIGQIVDSQIANIGNTKIIGQIVNSQLANNAVTTEKIAANSIIGNQIVANSITASQIAASSITGDRIAGSTITGTNIVGGTITASQIAAGSITGDRIAGNTITASQIAASTITGNLIASNTILSNNILAGAITGDKIAGSTITGDKISGSTITGDKIVAGTISAAALGVSSLSSITATIGLLRTSTTGARTEIDNNQIRVYDSNGVLRVRLGIW